MARRDDRPIVMEGCTKGDRHCHGRRRGPEAYDEQGRQRVCHQPAGWRTDHAGFGSCIHHGGSTPSNKAAAAKRRAAAITATYGGPIDIDPATALLEEVRRTAGAVDWLGKIVAALDPDALVFGKTEEIIRPEYTDGGAVEMIAAEVKNRAGANTWLTLYREERKHLVATSKAALDAGASQRIVDVFTEVGKTYIGMIESILDALDLTPAQAARVPTLITGKLEEIAGAKQ